MKPVNPFFKKDTELSTASIAVYGMHDDCQDDQFAVNWYDNGIHCDVFIMSGCDYGGGIVKTYAEMSAKKLDAFIEEAETAVDEKGHWLYNKRDMCAKLAAGEFNFDRG